MIETGIFGGSFNPIHKGHVQLAEYLCREKGLEEVWFLISPRNPFKQSSPDLLNEEARLHLTRLAIRNHPRLQASDFEFALPRPSYTVDTLRALRTTYPDRSFTLIIGADNWLAFDRWKSPEEILRHHRILVYPRPGFPIPATDRLPSGVEVANAPLSSLSSTEIRQSIARNEDASYGLEEAVWKEIQCKGYYKKA